MISAKVVADSINESGNRITSLVVVIPRIVLAELNTHRALSKNSASSRAIPFKKMAKMVEENPFIPIAFQKDHKGMQGTEYFTEEEIKKCSERKNSIQDVDLGFIVVRACFNVTKDAYMSTIIIYPGNSGSPVVSSTGSVVGVAFASDHTNWAYIVSLKDLKEFLKTY